MRQDVHLAALAAASRVAFSVALLGACGGAASELAEPERAGAGAGGAGYGASDAELSGGRAGRAPRVGEGAAAPCHEDAGAAKPACDAVLAAAFGDAGWFDPGLPVSAEVKTCCVESGATTDYDHPQHWTCCGALDWPGAACTPWGPPVPPAMRPAASREVA